jgi:thiamine kinase-like enzyme
LENLHNSAIQESLLKKTLLDVDKEFTKVKNKIFSDAVLLKLNIEKPIPNNQVIISPSDFGFHNAIITKDQNTVFLDFEYSGLDDPAKLVGDYFSQVSIPVDLSYIDTFIDSMCSKGIPINEVRQRSLLLLNLYKIKWICIVLNVFIPVNLQRRIFSNPELNIKKYKESQISMANKLLSKVEYGIY